MKNINRLVLTSLPLFISGYIHAQVSDSAKALAKSSIVIDTHIDVPYRLDEEYEDVTKATLKGDFDYPRAINGGLNVAFMSIYIPAELETKGAKKLADSLIDSVQSIVIRAPDKFTVATSVSDITQAFAAQKIALPMGMENGAPIEGSIENLRYFYKRGIRYITLAHSKSNHISDSSYDPDKRWKGLSEFGKKLIVEMNKIGMMVDVSHISDAAFYQVMDISAAPVIASHSSARHFTPGFERNMDDAMIQRLGKQGGVIQINFGSSFVTQAANSYQGQLTQARDAYLEEHGYLADGVESEAFTDQYQEKNPYPFATLSDVLDHIGHVVKLSGINAVGIGSDFDGVGDSLPSGLKDVAAYPNLIDGLLQRGYSNADIKKILGGNLLRVWKGVEDYAKASQAHSDQ